MVIRRIALARPEKKFAVSSNTTGTLETFPSGACSYELLSEGAMIKVYPLKTGDLT
jgi:hypothetical protein